MNKPLAKSLTAIPVGEKSLQHGKDSYDYTHILEPVHREAMPDAKVIVKWVPNVGPPDDQSGWLKASLHDASGKRLGEVEGDIYQKDGDGRKFFAVASAHLKGVPKEYNGRRLYFGRKLYEAAMAHAKNALGATHVGGGTHSTYASLAHQWISSKHGLGYEAMPNTPSYQGLVDPAVEMLGTGTVYNSDDWGYEGQPPESFDDRYAPYAYTMKMEKAENLSSIPIGAHTPMKAGHHYDYDHLLSEDHLKNGYRLEVMSYPTADSDDPAMVRAVVRGPAHVGPHDYASKVEAVYKHPAIHVTYAHSDNAHRGKGLGRAAYEAIMAHMKNLHGATELRGDEHSAKADKAHRALANKYGLSWIMEPSSSLSDLSSGHAYADFSPYALKLHEAVTDGEFEIRLAKDEVDPQDPIVQQLNQLIPLEQRYAPYAYDVRTLLRENGIEKKHLAYALKRISDLNLPESGGSVESVRYITNHPKFDKEVYESVTPDANNVLEQNNIRRLMLDAFSQGFHNNLIGNTIEKLEGNNFFLQEALKQVATDNKFKEEKKGDANAPRPSSVQDHDAHLDRTHRAFYRTTQQIFRDGTYDKNLFAGFEPDYRYGHNIRQRSAFIKKVIDLFPDGLSDLTKEKLLNYGKRLVGAFEKSKNLNRRPGSDLETEFDEFSPHLEHMVQSGLPESFTKGRLAKNLFNAILSVAPNYPEKKAQTLMDHFLSPEGMEKLGNRRASGYLTKLYLSHPKLTDEQWATLLANHPGHLPYDAVIANPRFNDDLAKKMWETGKDHDFLATLRNANKVTPEFANFVAEGLVPPSKEQEIAAAQQEAITNVQAPFKVENNVVKHGSWGGLHQAFTQNPYKFDASRIRSTFEAMGTTPSPEFFHKVLDRMTKYYKYRPPNVTEQEQGNWFDRVWGEGNHYYDHPSDEVFRLDRYMASRGVTDPSVDMALSNFLVQNDNIKHSDAVSEWLHGVKNEDAIKNVLQNATKSSYINYLMDREDAKPEWIATVEARPDFNVPAVGNPRFNYDNDPHAPRGRYAEDAQHFTNTIKNAVFNSPAFPPERIHSVITTTKNWRDVQKFLPREQLKPETMEWLMDQTPTKYGPLIPNPNGEYGYVHDPERGESAAQVITPGTVAWNPEQHANLIKYLANEKHNKFTPDMWRKLKDKGLLTIYQNGRKAPDFDPRQESGIRGIIAAALNNDSQTPTDVLNHLFDQFASGEGKNDYRTQNHAELIMQHPNSDPALFDRKLDSILNDTNPNTVEQIGYILGNLLPNPKVTSAHVQKMLDKMNSVRPAVPPVEEKPGAGTGGTYLERPEDHSYADRFWQQYAQSPFVSDEWLIEQKQKMDAEDAKIDEWKQRNPNGHAPWRWKDHDTYQVVNDQLAFTQPDEAHTNHPKVVVKVGSHPYRRLRDTIEASGGQVHIGEIQKHPIFSKIPVDKARVMREMTPEEYQKKFANVPEKKRPPPGVKTKTDFVSSQGVQGLIDALPPTNTWNVETREWNDYPDQMQNPRGMNEVFQLDVTNDHIKKIKEAGLMGVYKKIRQGILRHGGIHPMNQATIGWIRHYPVHPTDKTCTIDEIQCDLRPTGGTWVNAEKGYRGLLPGQNGRGWSTQALRNVIDNHVWGGKFPAADVDKVMDIIVGKKTDVHAAMLEAFHQHLRQKHGPDVKVFLPDMALQGIQRHYDGWTRLPKDVGMPLSDEDKQKHSVKDAPEHMYETYIKIPTSFGYDMRSSKHGDEAAQVSQNYHGYPYHTTKVSKREQVWERWENLCKAIETLPTLPLKRTTGGERIYNATHYLTDEHRKKGYTMEVRTHQGVYGKSSTAHVFHGSNQIGSVDALIEPFGGRKEAQISLSNINDRHIGQGLGLPMYEALMASAKAHWGATHVRGLPHSSMAHRVHQKLAEKHGLKYEAQPNVPSPRYPDLESWQNAPNKPMDSKYGNYLYSI